MESILFVTGRGGFLLRQWQSLGGKFYETSAVADFTRYLGNGRILDSKKAGGYSEKYLLKSDTRIAKGGWANTL